MNNNIPKVRVISTKDVEKINKSNVAYFTLTDGTVAVVKKDTQEKPTETKNNIPQNIINQNYYNYNNQLNSNIPPKNNLNQNYSINKIKFSNQYNNINNNIQEKSGYQIIEAIPVKFCENPQMRNYSQPEPLYVQPYMNPEIIFSEVEPDYDNNNNYYPGNNNYNFNQRNNY